jgi:hypothetical protein
MGGRSLVVLAVFADAFIACGGTHVTVDVYVTSDAGTVAQGAGGEAGVADATAAAPTADASVPADAQAGSDAVAVADAPVSGAVDAFSEAGGVEASATSDAQSQPFCVDGCLTFDSCSNEPTETLVEQCFAANTSDTFSICNPGTSDSLCGTGAVNCYGCVTGLQTCQAGTCAPTNDGGSIPADAAPGTIECSAGSNQGGLLNQPEGTSYGWITCDPTVEHSGEAACSTYGAPTCCIATTASPPSAGSVCGCFIPGAGGVSSCTL